MTIIDLAAELGWTPAHCPNVAHSCIHAHTDGTTRCIECGMTSLSFASNAQDWVDTHHKELVTLTLNLMNGTKLARMVLK